MTAGSRWVSSARRFAFHARHSPQLERQRPARGRSICHVTRSLQAQQRLNGGLKPRENEQMGGDGLDRRVVSESVQRILYCLSEIVLSTAIAGRFVFCSLLATELASSASSSKLACSRRLLRTPTIQMTGL